MSQFDGLHQKVEQKESPSDTKPFISRWMTGERNTICNSFFEA